MIYIQFKLPSYHYLLLTISWICLLTWSCKSSLSNAKSIVALINPNLSPTSYLFPCVSNNSKISGVNTYLPKTASWLGAFSTAGFSTISVSYTNLPFAGCDFDGSTIPYLLTSFLLTVCTPTTDADVCSYWSIYCFNAGCPSLLATTSSPSSTANGSSPMNDLAHRTACPNPFGSFCLI